MMKPYFSKIRHSTPNVSLQKCVLKIFSKLIGEYQC